MTSRTGNKATSVNAKGAHGALASSQGFTLIELILIMAILVIVMAVSAPSLSRFFRGRALDSEARRFVTLTRYGQSRAVSEGIPMVLWIDSKEGAYGLEADRSYLQDDPKAVEYDLERDVRVEVEVPNVVFPTTRTWIEQASARGALPKIRFTPDGWVSEMSPDQIGLMHEEAGTVWIALNQALMRYEVETNQVHTASR